MKVILGLDLSDLILYQLNKPRNDSDEEEEQLKKNAESNKKITYPNMSKFHDYYASSFGNTGPG